jgi:hypothetical protein
MGYPPMMKPVKSDNGEPARIRHPGGRGRSESRGGRGISLVRDCNSVRGLARGEALVLKLLRETAR